MYKNLPTTAHNLPEQLSKVPYSLRETSNTDQLMQAEQISQQKQAGLLK